MTNANAGSGVESDIEHIVLDTGGDGLVIDYSALPEELNNIKDVSKIRTQNIE